jgi:hypothetical protein
MDNKSLSDESAQSQRPLTYIQCILKDRWFSKIAMRETADSRLHPIKSVEAKTKSKSGLALSKEQFDGRIIKIIFRHIPFKVTISQ